MVKIAGEILVDIFSDNKSQQFFPGGAPFNVACNVKHFGGGVSFYGAVGNDSYGKFLKSYARRQHLDKLLIKTFKNRYTTQAIVSLSNGERSFEFKRDENAADYALSIKTAEKLDISKDDIVHIGSLMLSSKKGKRFCLKLIDLAKQNKALISFDVNYRNDIFESEAAAKRIYKKVLKEANIIKVSIDELSLLSNRKLFKGQIRSLFNKNQLVFVSKGKDGSTIYFNDKFIDCKSIDITPVDTTGAGDAYYSYILFRLDENRKALNDEQSLIDIVSKANIVGALSTLKKGAINVVSSLDLLNEYSK